MADGGRTDPDNLTILCWFHHHIAVHGHSEQHRFTAICRDRYAIAYPPDDDGSTTLPFSRLFIFARGLAQAGPGVSVYSST